MAKLATRLRLLEVVLLLAAAVVLLRAAQVQLLEGAGWREEAERVRQQTMVLPARRGGIYDRNGVPLAVTQEYFHVGIAPNELRDPAADLRAIARALELPLPRVLRDAATRRWIPYQGPFSGMQVQPLRAMPGVHLEGEYARQYPAGPLARGVIGTLRPDSGGGASGIEYALDTVLTGLPGEAVVLKDRAGRLYDSPSRLRREPVSGRDVSLTLDAELQEIAERALDDAVREFEAAGGDVAMMDPRTGELLALASRQLVDGAPVTTRPSFLTDPFEPGSTAKLFTAGALLALGRVDSSERVFAEHGVWAMAVNSRGDTRTIHDAHKTEGSLTLAQAIQVSSNIAMAKFSQRLSAGEQFDALRDFGFGSPTGVEFPSEARGALRPPNRWDGFSKASIAMGYEFQVTPVQLAAAYAAIANDGILLTPTLVREVRAPDGRTLYRHRPEPVRRAVSPAVAARLRDYLRAAVGEGGTAEAARLENYSLIGKTGTAVRNQGAGYLAGRYTASFAAIFPAEDPQLVVIVKIDDPKGKYYGGQTAAPLTRAMLEEALAARRSAIDRARLTGPPPTPAGPGADQVAEAEPAERRVVVPWPLPPDSAGRPGPRPVPDVVGSSIRRAANALHRRGFKVALRGGGTVARTTPAPGDSLPFGQTVTLWAQ